jgi:hypothetical protein
MIKVYIIEALDDFEYRTVKAFLDEQCAKRFVELCEGCDFDADPLTNSATEYYIRVLEVV